MITLDLGTRSQDPHPKPSSGLFNVSVRVSRSWHCRRARARVRSARSVSVPWPGAGSHALGSLAPDLLVAHRLDSPDGLWTRTPAADNHARVVPTSSLPVVVALSGLGQSRTVGLAGHLAIAHLAHRPHRYGEFFLCSGPEPRARRARPPCRALVPIRTAKGRAYAADPRGRWGLNRCDRGRARPVRSESPGRRESLQGRAHAGVSAVSPVRRARSVEDVVAGRRRPQESQRGHAFGRACTRRPRGHGAPATAVARDRSDPNLQEEENLSKGARMQASAL